MGHVGAQLVGAARHRLQRHPGQLVAGGLDHRVIGHRVAGALVAVLGDAHDGIVLALLLREESRDAALLRLRQARHQRPIDFARRPRAERAGEMRSRKARLGDQQAARGLAIDAVHEARLLALGIAHHLEHLVDVPRHARAALHGKAGRLVEDEDVVVFVDRHLLQRLERLLRRVRELADDLRRIELQRRDADALPLLEAVLAVDALAVDAEFAFADDALDMGERQAGEARLEEAVDTHVVLVRRHLDGLDLGRQQGFDGFFGNRPFQGGFRRAPLDPFGRTPVGTLTGKARRLAARLAARTRPGLLRAPRLMRT